MPTPPKRRRLAHRQAALDAGICPGTDDGIAATDAVYADIAANPDRYTCLTTCPTCAPA